MSTEILTHLFTEVARTPRTQVTDKFLLNVQNRCEKDCEEKNE